MKFFREPIFEPPARLLRFRRGLSFLPQKKNLTLLDLGSGPVAELYHLLPENVTKYIALDPLLRISSLPGKVKLIKRKIDKRINLPNESVDVVFSTAFIEHVDHPKEIITEAIRILKKGGRLILTTPTPRARILLEFLAFRMACFSRREIREHKNYFDRAGLGKLLLGQKLKKIFHRYFEFGLNNLLVVDK